MMRKKIILLVIMAFTAFLRPASTPVIARQLSVPSIEAPPVREYPVLTENRLDLLGKYMKLHYGTDSVALDRPAMIVVHYTVTDNLAATLELFTPERLGPSHAFITGHGDVNVGIHYVIDRDGTIYRLQPENIAGRHAIGFNWCALGIEMVAANEKALNSAQLASCARLCAWIVSRLPSVEYLIGHHEYTNKALPHYALYREYDPTYAAAGAQDPGDAFMKKLRAALSSGYSITLKD